jgi:hypothetical protein
MYLGVATGYGLDDHDSIPGLQEMFLCCTASRPALGLTEPPMPRVPDFFQKG